MKRLCAWCKTEITEPADHERAAVGVTHGICSPCLGALKERTSIPIGEFLSGLEPPVLLVEPEDHGVAAAGDGSGGLVWNPAAPEPVPRLGEVFECARATLPGGCGRTIHCSGCAIRLAVAHTHRTGESLTAVPATVRAVRDPGQSSVELLISTRRQGARVLLAVKRV